MLQARTSPLPIARTAAIPPGVVVTVAIQGLLRSKPLLLRLADVIRRHVLHMTPMSLMLSDLGGPDVAIQALEAFGRRLRDAGVPASPLIGICLCAPSPPLRAYSLITRCWFGSGPRYVIAGESQMQQPNGSKSDAQFWEYLWRHRGTRWAVLPAYSDSVSTPCPLLADERANAVLPTAGIQAPANSAWLQQRLHLPRFADSKGSIDREALTQTLIDCVDTGERQIDQQSWPTSGMQRDARLNRRMAIRVTGIGDLVRLQNANPSDLTVLRSLIQLMEYVRETVWNRSSALAQDADLLPSIARHDPGLSLADGQHSSHWAARWHAAVERCAVRHRNLLVISPYAVLPSAGDGCAAYTDLLPLIGWADAYSFAAPAPLQSWDFKDYCRFHRRARAVMQHRNGLSLVATKA